MTEPEPAEVHVAVIGAGQAGLSVAHSLQRAGLQPQRDFLVVDENPHAGGAWQNRWPSLTLRNVNGLNDLPGLSLSSVNVRSDSIEAAVVVPDYYRLYEEHFDLRVKHSTTVERVEKSSDGFAIQVSGPVGHRTLHARGLVSATGTWDRPYIPFYRGIELFEGKQLHAHSYRSADDFTGQRVAVVGAGITAVQLLQEVASVAHTQWFTRRPPEFTDEPFTPELGHRVIEQVESRVRQGLLPGSVVSNTSLPLTPALREARQAGILRARPVFSEITARGVRAAETAAVEPFDVILWCTGFRFRADHLALLGLRERGGGIVMDGKLATRVARERRVHLPGYGPTASTIGANRAGRVVVRELLEDIGGA